ncbi:MAG: hypothetical protein KC656_01410 [Myxococcales bacterium]|nr:hypothetical protein [Myxococcales bacterium]MCB9669551.1 hypothetical protein [Alphaproteobacteria bacterium]MCB9692065.1 hypothetical protein [Alphaproteobacteria bacterium]
MTRIALAILLTACTDRASQEGDGCMETVSGVGLDDTTALGVTPRALVDVAEGTHTGTFIWHRDASTTPVTLVITATETARFVDREPDPTFDTRGLDLAIICEDRVEVDVTGTFTTDDGAFAEPLAGALMAWGPDQPASLSVALDPDALQGTYDMDVDIAAVQQDPYDTRSLELGVELSESGVVGQVLGQITGEEACDGNDCAAWAAAVPVGTFE